MFVFVLLSDFLHLPFLNYHVYIVEMLKTKHKDWGVGGVRSLLTNQQKYLERWVFCPLESAELKQFLLSFSFISFQVFFPKHFFCPLNESA